MSFCENIPPKSLFAFQLDQPYVHEFNWRSSSANNHRICTLYFLPGYLKPFHSFMNISLLQPFTVVVATPTLDECPFVIHEPSLETWMSLFSSPSLCSACCLHADFLHRCTCLVYCSLYTLIAAAFSIFNAILSFWTGTPTLFTGKYMEN